MPDCYNDRQNIARRAFGDAERSREAHGHKMEHFNFEIREHSAMRNRALVLAGFTGLLTATWSIGSKREKSPMSLLSPKTVLRSLAGGLAIAFGVGRSLYFEREVYDIEFKRELWEIDNDLAGEIQEMVGIYRAQGLSGDDALMVTRAFAKEKILFANLMMVEELGYSRLEPPCPKEINLDVALPAAIGFAAGSLLPRIPAALTAVALRKSKVRVDAVGVGTLAICGVLIGVAQSEVYYGAYSTHGKAVKAVLYNLTIVGVIFGVARLSAFL